jgi:hypothetical protein
MRIESITKPQRLEWLQLATVSQGATFFHTPYWHDLASQCDGANEDGSLLLALEGGIKVIFPLLKMKHRLRGVFKRSISTFGTCYGGPICRVPLSREIILSAQQALMRRSPTLILVGNPFSPEQVWHPALTLTGMSTQVLELEGGFESLIKGFSKGHRAAYTKGRREGIVIRSARSNADVDAYYELYTQAIKRWGSSRKPYPKELFSGIVYLAEQRPQVAELWLAERQGVILAGAVLFYWQGHADYWHGATHEDHHASGATTFLLGEVIRDACERGFARFDFNPSGGHENVAAFKRRFGAREVSFQRAEYTHGALRVYDRLRQYAALR